MFKSLHHVQQKQDWLNWTSWPEIKEQVLDKTNNNSKPKTKINYSTLLPSDGISLTVLPIRVISSVKIEFGTSKTVCQMARTEIEISPKQIWIDLKHCRESATVLINRERSSANRVRNSDSFIVARTTYEYTSLLYTSQENERGSKSTIGVSGHCLPAQGIHRRTEARRKVGQEVPTQIRFRSTVVAFIIIRHSCSWSTVHSPHLSTRSHTIYDRVRLSAVHIPTPDCHDTNLDVNIENRLHFSARGFES